MKIYYAILIIVVLYLSLLSDIFATSITASGTATSNTVWTSDTVFVNGDITIQDGYTLTIYPGTYIEFQGNFAINVNGAINAKGSKLEPIIFIINDTVGFSDLSTSSGGWHGIRFNGTNATNNKSIISYCVLSYCKAYQYNPDEGSGSAIFIKNFSNVIISNCNLRNNIAKRFGAGIYCYNASPLLINNKIQLNIAEAGAGIYCYGSSPNIINNIISNNLSTVSGGAIYCEMASQPVITNNTICNNKALNTGGGMYCGTNSSPIVTNTILYYNLALNGGNELYIYDSESRPDFSYCNIQGDTLGFGLALGVSYNGSYIINYSNDPQLTDTNNNFSPALTSLCINAATEDTSGYLIPSTDINGNPRIFNGRLDIGAIEVQGIKIVCGTINENTVWHADTIDLICNILVDSTAKLIIRENTYIRLKNNCSISVYGSLQALGIPENEITFTRYYSSGKWGNITFYSPPSNCDISKIVYSNIQFSTNGITSNGSSKLEISNCNLANNNGNTSVISCFNSSNIIIQNNCIHDNVSASYGGAISCINSNPSIKNNNIYNNSTSDTNNGGTIFLNTSSSYISGNYILNNSAQRGGGIYLINSSPVIANTVICNNKAIYISQPSRGGGLYLENSSPLILNCNILENSSTYYGGGLYMVTSGPEIINSIIWGNCASTGNQVFLNDTIQHPNFSFCDIQGGNATGHSFAGSGAYPYYNGIYQDNIDSDPQFISPSTICGNSTSALNADLSLNPISPCVNTGSNASFGIAKDIKGFPRIYNNRIDMGAFELQEAKQSCGNITENTFWEADTVLIVCDINIKNGKVLNILRGTNVIFQGHYKVKVDGQLRAIGTRDSMIHFCAKKTFIGFNHFIFDNIASNNDTSIFNYCLIENGKANGVNEDAIGGAFFITNNSKLSIENSIFKGNHAGDYGGSIYIDGNSSNTRIINNVFIGNSAGKDGGGIYLYSSSPKIIGNCIVENVATKNGGGIYCFNHSNPNITNCTFAYNIAYKAGSELMCENISSPPINNSIFWGGLDSCNTEIYLDSYSKPNFSNNDIQHGLNGITYSNGTYNGIFNNNIQSNPLFINSLNSNYRIPITSPCIDMGSDSLLLLPEEDIDGNPRIVNNIDIGAYEYYYAPVSIYGQDTLINACEGDSVVIKIKFTGTNPVFSWKLNGVIINGLTANTLIIPSVSLSDDGNYICTISNASDTVTSATIVLNVNPVTVVSFTPIQDLCEGLPFVQLTEGTPFGGIYSGQGVVDNYFLPGNVSPGNINLTYNYINEFGCLDTATQIVKVFPVVNAGNNYILDICDLSDSVNLIAVNAADTGGVWTGSSLFAISDNYFIPSLSGTGTFEYSYTIFGHACADDSSSIKLNVFDGPDAGISDSINTCVSVTNLDLNDYLGQHDTTGFWKNNNTGMSATSIFSPYNAGVGLYSFSYIVPGDANCDNDTATIVINVVALPDPGNNLTYNVCETQQQLNLEQIAGSHDANGIWTDGTGATIDSIISLQNYIVGTYTFIYTVDNSVCSTQSATISIEILEKPNPGLSDTFKVCILDTAIDMDVLLGIHDGGYFINSITGATVSSIFSPNSAGAGIHNYMYIATGDSPCKNDTAYLSFETTLAPIPGNTATVSVCNSQDEINLDSFLGLHDPGGIWTCNNAILPENGVIPIEPFGIGNFPIWYIVDNNVCSPDSAMISLEIFEGLEAGHSAPVIVCDNETTVNLLSNLVGNDTISVIVYSVTGDTVGPVINITSLAPGRHDFYHILSTTNCANDTALIQLYILTKPEFSLIGNDTSCIEDSVHLISNNMYGNQWYLNGSPISGANSNIFYPQQSGIYRLANTLCDSSYISESMISLTIYRANQPEITSSDTTVFCQGGSVTLYCNPANSYQWSTGSLSQEITVDTSGEYSVTITDIHDCTASSTQNVTVNPIPIIQNYVVNGSWLGINDIGGTSYQWYFNGLLMSGLTQDLINTDTIGSGRYNVAVFNSYGCVAYAQDTLIFDSIINFAIIKGIPTCGENNGWIHVDSITGGLGEYTIIWSNSYNGKNNDSLMAGIYYVTVSDTLGYYHSKVVELNNIDGPEVSAIPVNIDCFGSNSGSVTLQISNDSTSLTYIWSTGDTSASIENLFAGTYEVTVTNAYDCIGVASTLIVQNPEIQSTFVINNATCGGNDGAVMASISGGLSPYSYHWSNNLITANLQNIIAGIYSLTITDSLGCTKEFQAAVNEINGPQIDINSIQPSACYASNGAISVHISNGTTPYSYNWSNGANFQDITTLDPGTYSLTVTDATGCMALAVAEVPSLKPSTPEICLVTVDSILNVNKIIWEKNSQMQYYSIYREGSSAGVYQLIGTKPISEESVFIDSTASPVIKSWRYKISCTDYCGIESDLSPYHKTMHLLIINQATVTYLLWDHYEGFSFSPYIIKRSTGFGWYSIGYVTPPGYTFTDMNPPYGVFVKYVVEIERPSPCISTKTGSNHNTSRSNDDETSFVPPYVNYFSNNLNDYLQIIPNPNEGVFDIKMVTGNHENIQLFIYNIYGEMVKRMDIVSVKNNSMYHIDLRHCSPGIYLIQGMSNNWIYNQKIIIK